MSVPALLRPAAERDHRSRQSSRVASPPYATPPCLMAFRMRVTSCVPSPVSSCESGDSPPKPTFLVCSQAWASSVQPNTASACFSTPPIPKRRSLTDVLRRELSAIRRLAAEGERPTRRKTVVCGILSVSASPRRWQAGTPARSPSIRLEIESDRKVSRNARQLAAKGLSAVDLIIFKANNRDSS